MSLLKTSKTKIFEKPTTFLDNTNNKNINVNTNEISLKKEICSLKEKIKELEYENKTYLLKITDLTKSKIFF